MDGIKSSYIPALMISNEDGRALKEFMPSNSAAMEINGSTILSKLATRGRVLSAFSAKGPSLEFGLKPDLLAVGEFVYSATLNSNSRGDPYPTPQFTNASGTSFSAPMVAGAAAVLKQMFPGFTPQEVKSVLTETASRNLSRLDGTTVPNIMEAGSGLLDMERASTAGAVISPGNLNFGVRGYSTTISLQNSITIKNISSTSDQFTITVEPMVAGPAFSLSADSTGPLPPGGSESIEVKLTATAPMSGGFQGFIAVQSTGTSSVYRVPYWAGVYVPDSSRVLTVAKTAKATDTIFNTLDDALAQARPGNIIEIADSETYWSGQVLATNRDGLPLHGVTIRAAAGKNPVLKGSGATAGLRVLGLQNLLLQGITLQEGDVGIWVTQLSASSLSSVTIDHCTISNMADFSSSSGVVVDGGATVNITQSIISGSTGPGILALEGSQITLSGTTLDKNGDGGITAHHSNVQILRSTISNHTKAGATLESCSGTIDESNFVKNTGSTSDGLALLGGRFTITNSTFDSNTRAGIGLFQSAVATIAGNIIRSNVQYGILTNPASVRIEANLIKLSGAVGVYIKDSDSASLVNNIVTSQVGSNSWLGAPPFSSDRLNVVQFINNTCIAGSTTWVRLAGFNSIFETQTSQLVDALSDNYDIRPTYYSRDVDQGDNGAPGLPFLDYKQHLRVAGAGSRAGEGKVDLGAIEMGSNYPLVFPLLANGNLPALGDDLTTGLAVVNTGTASANVRFSAYGESGEFLGGNTLTVAAGAQVPVLGYQLFGFDPGKSQLGAVLADSDQKLAGFFMVFDREFKRFADGVDVAGEAATDLLLMRHIAGTATRTTYFLFNPGVNPATVDATLYAASGSAAGSPQSSVIAPKGLCVFSFDGIAASAGYVKIRSDRPISGLELFGDTQGMSALKAVSPGSDGRLYFPHFAVNQGYATNIGIINSGDDFAHLVLTAYTSDGYILGKPVNRELWGRAQLLEPVANLFGMESGTLFTGYVVVQSDRAGLVGFTDFRYDDGRVQSGAAVPAASIPRQKLIFSHIAHQVAAGAGGNYQTGIALLNPFGVPVQYTIRVFDGQGNKVAEATDTIGKNEKIAKILSYPVAGAGFFTKPLPLGSGHVEVTSDYGLLGFELFFTEDMSQLASVPAQIVR
ncbi:MAG: right-handed parallel beta-helix repeat-containing protein [Acidobacteriia bacterium]|nr:right-handed parallel beta-helix repeat-containing protein [Terriglobia bacterium]